jgi:acetyl-CoA acetyltransferase
LAGETAPVEVKSKKGVELVTTDEHPRVTDAAKLAKLAPVFKKEGCVFPTLSVSI